MGKMVLKKYVILFCKTVDEGWIDISFPKSIDTHREMILSLQYPHQVVHIYL